MCALCVGFYLPKTFIHILIGWYHTICVHHICLVACSVDDGHSSRSSKLTSSSLVRVVFHRLTFGPRTLSFGTITLRMFVSYSNSDTLNIVQFIMTRLTLINSMFYLRWKKMREKTCYGLVWKELHVYAWVVSLQYPTSIQLRITR